MKSRRIGLALSGGGYRALVFHLGVLARLAGDNLLEEVSFISTVSGGSLAAALIYAANDYRWPSSQAYLSTVIPEIRRFLPNHNLARELKCQLFSSPWAWLRRGGNKLARVLSSQWGMQTSIQTVPDHPRWIINATCYETFMNWRFMSRRMGDNDFGYVMNPDIQLAAAVAASAAHPMIGPATMDTTQYHWEQYLPGSTTETCIITPKYEQLLLWDGAVYDNLGVEALTKPGTKLRRGVDFLIVSDASAPIKLPRYWLSYPSAKRLYDITARQVNSLRTRLVMDFLVKEPTKGRYLKLGNHADYILSKAHKVHDLLKIRPQTLPADRIQWVRNIKTEDTDFDTEMFDLVYRHGYEIADLTLYAHGSDQDGYAFKGYSGLT